MQLDMDQQDYLGVLLGDPGSFGSEAGGRALAAAPADTGDVTPTLYSFVHSPGCCDDDICSGHG